MTQPETNEQKLQEEEYRFPYHYIPHFDHGFFNQVRRMDWGAEYMGYMNFVIEKIKDIKPQNMCDVGCGDGRFLHELSKQHSESGLKGVDTSEASLRFARAFNPRLNFENIDVTNGSISENPVDLITLIDVLEHISLEYIADFVKGLDNNLSESGTLIVTVPCDNIPLQNKHFQHFNKESLENCLRPHFSEFQFFYLNRYSKLNNIIKRFFINPYLSVSHLRLQNLFYRWYQKNLILAEPHNACRICVVCKK